MEREEYVRLVVERSRPLSISLGEIERASHEDDCIRLIKMAIQTGDWRSVTTTDVTRTEEARQRLTSLYHVKEELAVTAEGCLLRGPRLVMPSSRTQRAVDLAHQSHQGMVKTKGRLQSKVWFPLLDTMVENTVRSCAACQSVGPLDPPAPVITEDIPPHPWHRAIADFGSLPGGRQMLVFMDDFS